MRVWDTRNVKNSFHKPVYCAGNLGPTGAAVESLKLELTIQIRADFEYW